MPNLKISKSKQRVRCFNVNQRVFTKKVNVLSFMYIQIIGSKNTYAKKTCPKSDQNSVQRKPVPMPLLYLLIDDSVFATGFWPDSSFESLSKVSAGPSARKSATPLAIPHFAPLIRDLTLEDRRCEPTMPRIQLPFMLIVLTRPPRFHVFSRNTQFALC